MKNKKNKFNKMKTLNDLPEIEVNKEVDAFEAAFDLELEAYKLDCDKKFKDEYARECITKFNKNLCLRRKFYVQMRDNIINNLIVNGRMNVIIYGPDHQYEQHERTSIDNAITRVVAEFAKKGYIVDVNFSTRDVVDCMEGHCTVGTKTLVLRTPIPSINIPSISLMSKVPTIIPASVPK